MKALISLLILASLFVSTLASAAPKSELWPHWDVSNEQSTQSISHAEWQSLLDSYLVVDGQHVLFRYSDVTNQDKLKLEDYIELLSSVTPQKHALREQYAYWVNLYNALTVDIILDNYPISSITKIGGFFSFGPWGQEVVTVDGKKLTLNDIEHRILRPIWNDPRTHYAVNCASLGCPNLQSQAFTSDNTEKLLELAAKEYINSDKGAKLKGNRLQLSSIYEWFESDFGTKTELFDHLSSYREDLIGFEGKIQYDYDWDLNEK
ncbi:DUF547 domain-containing protein [uncultured Vibrio sp.]|uniref:DUF547 domain-containing protein n=1 Tax=uncultured Vibrio sp. TaxID=114054 RepID=UPI0009231559|nr:DUF547 domain-containing protein [uncultured Vibrio sp.]OIQ24288.1 MAG: Ser/Thr protein kinase [Vibrio sp. MedPE-SWchi]